MGRYAILQTLSSYTREREKRNRQALARIKPVCAACGSGRLLIHLDSGVRRCTCVICDEQWNWPESD